MSKRLADFSVLTFDCYGTLIDWETGIWDALQPLIQINGCETVSRNTALSAFAEVENAQESETPDMLYPDLLTRVHARLAERFDLHSTPELDAVFGASIPHWPAFPDTADALRFLKRQFKLVILSNVNRDGFAASNRKLGVVFDAVYTAQDIGSYKPAARNFEYLLDHLDREHGAAPGEILHTAQSMFHDHVPAKHAGLARAWIDRQGLSKGGSWGATARVEQAPEADFLFPTMGAMATAVRAETGNDS